MLHSGSAGASPAPQDALQPGQNRCNVIRKVNCLTTRRPPLPTRATPRKTATGSDDRRSATGHATAPPRASNQPPPPVQGCTERRPSGNGCHIWHRCGAAKRFQAECLRSDLCEKVISVARIQQSVAETPSEDANARRRALTSQGAASSSSQRTVAETEGGGARTHDLRIKSPLLFRLSYTLERLVSNRLVLNRLITQRLATTGV